MTPPRPVVGASTVHLAVRDYDLAATLTSGQAFRWREREGGWEGVIAGRWVRLMTTPDGIAATRAAAPVNAAGEGRTPIAAEAGGREWAWLTHYLQTSVDFEAIRRTFPADEPIRASLAACRGLRLLRQDPWECLVSFICSSTKQIVQIAQIIELLCDRFGDEIPSGVARPAQAVARAFPSPGRLAAVDEAELRACKMGFRAPYVSAAARAVAGGDLDLEGLRLRTCAEAREALMRLPGVGPKVANCVLLFAYGFPEAFPVDVWVMKALRELYFPRRRPSAARLRRFVETYFGPHAGYAQQYLFHYMRTREENPLNRPG